MVASDSAYLTGAYLRIAALSIALYDFLESGPRTWKYIRDQWKAPRITVSFVLFLLLQITSIGALVATNVAFFGQLTERACVFFSKSRIIAISKTLQSIVSQIILGLRVFNLSRRSKLIGWFLLGLFIATTASEFLSSFLQRVSFSVQNSTATKSCGGVYGPTTLPLWSYYVFVIIYDVVTTALSIIYLLKSRPASYSSFMKVIRMMLYDGIGYFVALTTVNIINLIIFEIFETTNTAAGSLRYTATWIMCQRLIIHLHEISLERNRTFNTRVTSSENLSRDQVIQTELEPQHSLQLTAPDFDISTAESEANELENMNVGSRAIEKTDRFGTVYDLEN